MRWWYRLSQCLCDLAHALSSVLFSLEHVTFRHVKSDIGSSLIDELCYHFVRLLAESLSYWIQEDTDQITMLGEPLIDTFDVEPVSQAAISQAWSINKDDLFKVSQLRHACLDRDVVQ